MKILVISQPQHQSGEPPWPADGTYWVQTKHKKNPKKWEGMNWIKLIDAIKLVKLYHYSLVSHLYSWTVTRNKIDGQPRPQYQRHICPTKEKKVYKNRWTKYKNYINIQRLFISKTNMSVKIVSALKYERPRVSGTRKAEG